MLGHALRPGLTKPPLRTRWRGYPVNADAGQEARCTSGERLHGRAIQPLAFEGHGRPEEHRPVLRSHGNRHGQFVAVGQHVARVRQRLDAALRDGFGPSRSRASFSSKKYRGIDAASMFGRTDPLAWA
jgi:hypothetical protein